MNWIKYMKLIIGTVAAIVLARFFQLEYAYAAGIITLLTIQDTKQETLMVTIKRLIIFVMMTLLSVLLFPVMQYSVLAFATFLIPYLLICLLLDMKESIAPIAVLATHYISSSDCSLRMITNELEILLIGSGIGVVINLFFQDNTRLVQQKQILLDEQMKSILKRMSFYITVADKSKYNDACFHQLDQLLEDMKVESIRYLQNHFLRKDDYFYDYMQLRYAQCNLLKRIYTDMIRIDIVPEQAKAISHFLSVLAAEFHELNNAESLSIRLRHLNSFYDQIELPSTRAEFRNRAMLYHILKDLEALVELKRAFMLNNSRCL